ncbi:MAG: glycosyltransferase family 4 protein [Candidatus Thermoplasmatota archaeon]|nr:glycosyltransferase family 4 protein [Candidatus Thermoplasmatota archaeon]
MKVNFIVEDSGAFQYLGCATAAKNLQRELSKKIEISYNNSSLDFDVAHFHTFGPKSLWYFHRFKGKSVITAHSTPRLNEGNLALPELVNWLYRPIYNQFDHIISVSEKCRKELIELGCKPRIKTIYNGIDTSLFQPDNIKRKKFRKEMNLSDQDTLVVTVGQRTPRKGIYDFLQTAKRFPEYHFLWIGGFPYSFFSKDYRKIKNMLKNRSKNTYFPGFVEDIFAVYSAADLFFMPSYAEGHSIVMLEALSMKLPMIARETEEFKEVFNGSLQYFSSVNDLNKDMFSIEKQQEYQQKAKEVSKYHIEDIANQHIHLYEKIVDA